MDIDDGEVFTPMIGDSNRRMTARGCYRGFVVTSLLLILIAHALVITLGFVYWNKIGYIAGEVMPIISNITGFLAEAQDDLQKFSSFADFLEKHEVVLEVFLSNLGLIDRAAECTLATHNCPPL